MRRSLCLAACLTCAGCISDSDSPAAFEPAQVVAADPRGPWSAPVPITAVNSTANDQAPAISPNGLEFYFEPPPVRR